MQDFFYFCLDFLFPIECISCGARGSDICEHCIDGLLPPKEKNYEWIFSIGNYHDPVMKKIMWHIKRMPNERALQIIAQLFADTILNRPKNPHDWLYIPIPISRTRSRERGYNQSELIGSSVSVLFGFPVIKNCLIKSRHTRKQGISKSKEERMVNITDSFSVSHPEYIKDKSVIIIDDITTTGSTLVEARNILLAAGASRVTAWTVAN